MKFLKEEQPAFSAEFADEHQSKAIFQAQALELQKQLEQLAAQATSLERAQLLLQIAHAQVGAELKQEAWENAAAAVKVFLFAEQWELAVEAFDILFLSELPGALAALGQGVWLAVTFPIDPELSVALLDHIVEETPSDSDGAAVAAATACYIVDLRAEGKSRDKLQFFTNQLLGKVARRHSNIETQAQFDAWIQRLQLDTPSYFLGRLSLVLEVLIQDDWWFDRDELRMKIPDQ